MVKNETNKIVSLLNKIRGKKIVDKDLRDMMIKSGMKKQLFYSVFQTAVTKKLINQKFNGKSYTCSLTKKGKEELKQFKFMLKEDFLKKKK